MVPLEVAPLPPVVPASGAQVIQTWSLCQPTPQSPPKFTVAHSDATRLPIGSSLDRITGLHRSYELVRPSVSHQYSHPRGSAT